MVNQLLNVHAGARLPLLSAVREERLLGVQKRLNDFGISRFTYDEDTSALWQSSRMALATTRGVSEIRLALRYRPTTRCCAIFLKIPMVSGDCGLSVGMVTDPPMLAQDYFKLVPSDELLQGQRAAEWAANGGNFLRRARSAGNLRR